MSDADARERPIEAEYREYIRGNLPEQDDPDAHPWTGLVHDAELREVLAFCEKSYEPLTSDAPRDFADHRVAEEITKKHGTDAGTQALAAGNMSQLSFFSGLVGYQKDVSGMQTLMSLQQMIEDAPVFICYIWGLMGSGKSNFAMLLLEVFSSVYGEDNVYRCANITSDSVDEEITRYARMVEILEERRDQIQAGEDLDPLVMLIDEAAQLFSGSGKDQHRAKQLAKILKLARKSKANVLLLGQDGKDIGPSLRALCTCFVEKKSEKRAVFFQDVEDREGVNQMMELSGVPPTSLDWSTWDEGEFKFEDEDEDEEDLPSMDDIRELEEDHEREMMAILSVSSELTNSEIGDIYDVSERTVRRAKAEYEEKLEELDLV